MLTFSNMGASYSSTNFSLSILFISSTSHACVQYESWTPVQNPDRCKYPYYVYKRWNLDHEKTHCRPAKFNPAFLQATAVIIIWEPSREWTKLGAKADFCRLTITWNIQERHVIKTHGLKLTSMSLHEYLKLLRIDNDALTATWKWSKQSLSLNPPTAQHTQQN